MILQEKLEVAPRLEELELDLDRLIEVVRYADGERALCNANDPPGFDLITMNARTARGLRHEFCGERWELDQTDNQPGIRNRYIKMRVIHCNFDKHCGDPEASPTNLTEKGSASGAKASCNRTGWLPGLPMPKDDQAGFETYVLGTYYDKDVGEVRAELSRPLNFSSGRYKKFHERIILIGPGAGKASGSRSAPDKDSGPTEIIDIPIARK